MKLLHLDSSILGDHSASRALTANLVDRLKSLHPGLDVTYHDLAAESVRHLSGAHLASDAQHHDEALSADVVAGGRHLQELLDTDLLVIGAPMYNFSIPSQLKAWLDRVVVAGKTFRYGPDGRPVGLATGKKAYIVATRGGFYQPGAPAAAMEFHDTYLKSTLAFIGITDVTVIHAEGLSIGPEARARAINDAETRIGQLAA